MKRTLLALLLSGAGTLAQAQATIDVQVVGGQLVVSQEQLQRAAGQTSIVWVLRTAGYLFPADGVRISPAGEHRCQQQDKSRQFRCDKVASPGSKQYSYVIKLTETGTMKSVQPPQPDLWIQDE